MERERSYVVGIVSSFHLPMAFTGLANIKTSKSLSTNSPVNE